MLLRTCTLDFLGVLEWVTHSVPRFSLPSAKVSLPGRGTVRKALLGLQDAWGLHQWRPYRCQEQICIYISRQLQTYCDSIKFKHFKIKAAISSFLGSRKSIIKTNHQHRNNWDYSHSKWEKSLVKVTVETLTDWEKKTKNPTYEIHDRKKKQD